MPLPLRVKRIVYERAKGKCQRCGTPLKMNEGDFHHKGVATSERPSSIVFLCPNCHRKYGHEYRTVKHDTLFGLEKEVRVIHKRVVRKKRRTYKTIALHDSWTGEVIGHRRIRIRRQEKKGER
jgi:5-methylcytosine-specific restriction endonuclease McrA